jgi:hypothetical protein
MLCNVRSKYHERDRGDESRYAGGGGRIRTKLALQEILSFLQMPQKSCKSALFSREI